jgi:hypothetical protein
VIITTSSNLTKDKCQVVVQLRLLLLQLDDLQNAMDKFVTTLNGTLILGSSWATSNNMAMRIICLEQVSNARPSKFLNIVGMKDLGVPNQTEVLLKLMCNMVHFLVWEGHTIHEASQMGLYRHYPMLGDAVDILMPHFLMSIRST